MEMAFYTSGRYDRFHCICTSVLYFLNSVQMHKHSPCLQVHLQDLNSWEEPWLYCIKPRQKQLDVSLMPDLFNNAELDDSVFEGMDFEEYMIVESDSDCM